MISTKKTDSAGQCVLTSNTSNRFRKLTVFSEFQSTLFRQNMNFFKTNVQQLGPEIAPDLATECQIWALVDYIIAQL